MTHVCVVLPNANEQLAIEVGRELALEYLNLPLLGHGVLDSFEPQVRQLAAVAYGVAPCAEVVGVGLAGAAPRDAVLQAAAATATVHGSS